MLKLLMLMDFSSSNTGHIITLIIIFFTINTLIVCFIQALIYDIMY